MKRLFFLSMFLLLYVIYSFSSTFNSLEELKTVLENGDILYDVDGLAPFGSDKSVKTGHIGIFAKEVYFGGILWRDQIIEATLAGRGVYMVGVETWYQPNVREFYVLRAKTSEAIKTEAVNFALNQVGKHYSVNYLSANASADNAKWYCSELVWAAYLENGQGIDIADLGNASSLPLLDRRLPVTPEDIFRDDSINPVAWFRLDASEPLPTDAIRVHNITKGHHYTSINNALEDCSPGDTIELDPGGFLGRVVIDVPDITIRALGARPADTTIQKRLTFSDMNHNNISLDKTKNTIEITAPGVTLENFTVTGAREYNPEAAIYLSPEAHNTTLRNMITFYNVGGIGVEQADRITIENCELAFNTVGLGLYQSYASTIRRNIIRNSFNEGMVATEDKSYCSAQTLAQINPDNNPADLNALRSIRDHHLPDNLVDLYYRASPDLVETFSYSPDLSKKTAGLMFRFLPLIEEGSDYIISSTDVLEIKSVLDSLIARSHKKDALDFLFICKDKLAGLSGQSLESAIKGLGPQKLVQPVAFNYEPTEVYLNYFSGNDKLSENYYETGRFNWYSNQVISYQYQGAWHRSRLGNFWDSYTGYDNNRDGIGDEPYYGDLFPLLSSPANYFLERESPPTSINSWILY